MTTTTRTTPLTAAAAMRAMAPASRPLFDRAAWEGEVLASSLHRHARLVGLALAHLADQYGELPAGGPQGDQQLAASCGMEPQSVRISLSQLERRHFLSRPTLRKRAGRDVRPVTLTMPAPARRQPPSPGDPR